ncbi:hypothetical protein F4808DRAFT_201052 [Astrocystis sublimbata]|nr:hypothetical protein F4808DRAFT_201052 [Astrocystis sublimbata]
MAAAPVVLILGSGPRVGACVAQKFASSGYKVAVTSRNAPEGKTPEGYLSLRADFTKPDTVPAVFEAVKAEFKAPPTVVVYNAAALEFPPEADSPLSISSEKFTIDLNVNAISPYVAAQQALAGWDSLPKGTKTAFIFTGNILNTVVAPMTEFTNLGVGKSAAAYWIGVADMAYTSRGYRFHYADERIENGKSKGPEIDGPAHAEFYAQLAKHEGDVPWHATFVTGKGYMKFH